MFHTFIEIARRHDSVEGKVIFRNVSCFMVTHPANGELGSKYRQGVK